MEAVLETTATGWIPAQQPAKRRVGLTVDRETVNAKKERKMARAVERAAIRAAAKKMGVPLSIWKQCGYCEVAHQVNGRWVAGFPVDATSETRVWVQGFPMPDTIKGTGRKAKVIDPLLTGTTPLGHRKGLGAISAVVDRKLLAKGTSRVLRKGATLETSNVNTGERVTTNYVQRADGESVILPATFTHSGLLRQPLGLAYVGSSGRLVRKERYVTVPRNPARRFSFVHAPCSRIVIKRATWNGIKPDAEPLLDYWQGIGNPNTLERWQGPLGNPAEPFMPIMPEGASPFTFNTTNWTVDSYFDYLPMGSYPVVEPFIPELFKASNVDATFDRQQWLRQVWCIERASSGYFG